MYSFWLTIAGDISVKQCDKHRACIMAIRPCQRAGMQVHYVSVPMFHIWKPAASFLPTAPCAV